MCLWSWFKRVLHPLIGSPAWCVCAWLLVGGALVASGQSSITNDCFVISCPADRTNSVCVGPYEFAESGLIISNQCPEVGLPPHSIVCEPPLGTLLEAGQHPVTCRVMVNDEAVVECQFGIRVQVQTGLPGFSIALDRFFEIPCNKTNHPAGYPTPFVTNGILVRCEPPPGGRNYPVGTNWVTCIASNMCGQTEYSFTVTLVHQPDPPPLMTPPSVSTALIECTSPCGVVNYSLPTVSGGGGYVPVCTPPSGTCFPLGASTVTCRVTNRCGVSNEISFRVAVSRPSPHAPIFPDAYRPDEGEWSLGTFTNHCRSNCLPVNYPLPSVQMGWLDWCRPPPGSCFPVGTNVIACRATNYCTDYNTSFRVIVVQGPPLPSVLRLTRTESSHTLEWEERCPGEALLQKAEEPDGPWTPIPAARPGFTVSPTERRQYFRLIVE